MLAGLFFLFVALFYFPDSTCNIKDLNLLQNSLLTTTFITNSFTGIFERQNNIMGNAIYILMTWAWLANLVIKIP